MIAAAPARRRRNANGASLDRYAVKFVPIGSVNAICDEEVAGCKELCRIRAEIAGQLGF